MEPLHMHCKTLTYADELGEVKGVVEDTPDGGMMLWERDFDCSEVRKVALLKAVEQRMTSLGRKCHVIWGEPRVPPADT
jgi:transposase